MFEQLLEKIALALDEDGIPYNEFANALGEPLAKRFNEVFKEIQ